MFDVGFSELILVALVALVVLGPERLPKAARVAGMWVGRARRTLATVKQEIDREIKADELSRILKEQAQSNPLETIIEETSAALKTPTAPRVAKTATPVAATGSAPTIAAGSAPGSTPVSAPASAPKPASVPTSLSAPLPAPVTHPDQDASS